MTIHTHIETSSRDCDGAYDRAYVTDRRIDIADLPSTYSVPGSHGSYTLDYESSERSQELLWRISASAPTEEGYSATEMRECDDLLCDLDKTLYRDHTAERAGY